MNVRDSEAVEALLLAAGHEKAVGEADADLVIVNSCTVRQKAEEKAVGKAGYLCSTGKVVGLMGCAVKRMGEQVFARLPKLDFAVGPRRFGLIPRLLERIAAGERRILEVGDDDVPLGLDAHPDIARAGTSAQFQSYVTVLLGCDNRCSYCIVPDVRGHEYSRPAREVIAEVRCLAERGVKEVCLLGQSVLRYGVRNRAWAEDEPNPHGYAEAFPRLLAALNEIPCLERIRFTSAHPKGCTDELVRVYRECPKVCRHLHLPVQSGSSSVLKRMNRKYDREWYLDRIAAVKRIMPECGISTDVFCGFSGETLEDQQQTLSLMREVGFDSAFMFKYSERPGTFASRHYPDDIAEEEKIRRLNEIIALQNELSLESNRRDIGKTFEVLVEGYSKRSREQMCGRTQQNKMIVFPKGDAKPGDFVMVKVSEATSATMLGEIVG